MKTIFTRLLAGSMITATLLTACSKNKTIDELNNGPQQTTAAKTSNATEEPAILNQDLVVTSVRDGGADITEQFDDFTFKFVGSMPSGEAQVWNDLLARTGTWSMPQGASSINISYPTDVFTQLAFLNRLWTIAAVSQGVIVLTAADGDEVRLANAEPK